MMFSVFKAEKKLCIAVMGVSSVSVYSVCNDDTTIQTYVVELFALFKSFDTTIQTYGVE